MGAPSSRHHPAVAVVASSGTGESGQGARPSSIKLQELVGVISGVGFYVPMFHITQLPRGIFHLQQIWEGDVKQIPKKGHLPTPVKYGTIR